MRKTAWNASSASCELPRMRRQTPCTMRPCRDTRAAKASSSRRSTQRSSNSASLDGGDARRNNWPSNAERGGMGRILEGSEILSLYESARGTDDAHTYFPLSHRKNEKMPKQALAPNELLVGTSSLVPTLLRGNARRDALRPVQ